MKMVSDWLTMVSWRRADDVVVFTDGERWVVFTDGYVHGKTRVGEAWQFILEKNIPFKHLFSNIISKGQGAPCKWDGVRWDELGQSGPSHLGRTVPFVNGPGRTSSTHHPCWSHVLGCWFTTPHRPPPPNQGLFRVFSFFNTSTLPYLRSVSSLNNILKILKWNFVNFILKIITIISNSTLWIISSLLISQYYSSWWKYIYYLKIKKRLSFFEKNLLLFILSRWKLKKKKGPGCQIFLFFFNLNEKVHVQILTTSFDPIFPVNLAP